jgi:L-seryl-tRNA(Ser) seleniumtransferase
MRSVDNSNFGAPYSAIPSVDRVMRDPAVEAAVGTYGRAIVVQELRALLARQRSAIEQRQDPPYQAEAGPVQALLARLASIHQPSIRRVFNLTGTVLHTNLGRAVLPAQAIEAAGRVLGAPSNLEYDLDRGARGERDAAIESLLQRLTNAESAVLANNNAAAVLLALNSLARGREVLVSRGELVEIGGSFRMPEIIEAAGCTLREVGTTNRTHPQDFEHAITRNTAAILKVHASNYAISGFVAAPREEDLARLAHAHDLPFITDLGSGSLLDLTRWGLPAEPTPMQALEAGADLVTFSGDKLLGGPQVGIAVGGRAFVQRLRRNPMRRALRLDKGRIAALEAVLRLYLDPDRIAEHLPTLNALTRPVGDIDAAAQRMLPAVQSHFGEHARVEVAPCASQIGSGSLPVDRLPSAALRIEGTACTDEAILKALRALPIPVIARAHRGAVWLDLRCLDDEPVFVEQLRRAPFRPPS